MDIKELRARQQARHMPHIKERGAKGAEARAMHFHDAIVDWFVAEVVQWNTSPVDITSVFGTAVGAAAASITRSLAATMKHNGAPPPPLGTTHEEAVGIIVSMEVSKAFADFMTREADVHYGPGTNEKALKDTKENLNG